MKNKTYSFTTWAGVKVINSTCPKNENFGSFQTIENGTYKIIKKDGSCVIASISCGELKGSKMHYSNNKISALRGEGNIQSIERIPFAVDKSDVRKEELN